MMKFKTILEALEFAKNDTFEVVTFNSNNGAGETFGLSDLNYEKDLDLTVITQIGEYELSSSNELLEISDEFDIKTICFFS